jgi:hypothetical protein
MQALAAKKGSKKGVEPIIFKKGVEPIIFKSCENRFDPFY